MISVIIPVYNSENYLKRCINSILDSTFDDFEIILVNDGSTDKSQEICEQFSNADKRVKLLNQENAGASSARNTGIAESAGDWIVFVDSDDYIHPRFLEMVAAYADSQYDCLIFGYSSDTLSSTENSIMMEFSSKQEKLMLIRKTLTGENISLNHQVALRTPWSKAFRRRIIIDNRLLFYTQLKIGEDEIFNIQYYLIADKIAYVPDAIYHLELHEGSIMSSFQPALLENDIFFQHQLQSTFMNHDIFSDLETDFYLNVLKSIKNILQKNVFNKSNTLSFSEKCKICDAILSDEIYLQAKKYIVNLKDIRKRMFFSAFFNKRYFLIMLFLLGN